MSELNSKGINDIQFLPLAYYYVIFVVFDQLISSNPLLECQSMRCLCKASLANQSLYGILHLACHRLLSLVHSRKLTELIGQDPSLGCFFFEVSNNVLQGNIMSLCITTPDNQYKQDFWLYRQDNRDKLYSRGILLIDAFAKTQ